MPTGWTLKINSLQLLLMFELCSQIFTWNFTQLLSNNIYTLPPNLKFCWNIFENNKLMLFQLRQPPFLSVQSIVFTSSLLVALKRAGLLVMTWGCRLGEGQSYCRCSKWPPLAAIAKYAVKHMVKFPTVVLVCSCGSSSQMVCRAAFNSSVVLGFG